MTLKPNLIVIAVLGWACSNLVFAQQVPGGAQPGQIERQLQKPPQPRAGGDAIVPPTPDQKPPANADNVRFMLNRVTVDGSTVYKDAELQSAAASFVGKEVTLTQIYRIAEALTRRYRNDGYILSQVVVPAQNIQNGAVRLQVIEGYVATARVTGANRVSTWQLEAFLAPVLKARPLNAQVLERSLLLINDLAGVTARTTLSPSQQPGAADLTVNVAESARSIKLGVNNRGGKFLGPLRLTADADFNSVFGGGDRTGLRLIRTPLNSELTLVSASHERPVGANGLKLNGSMSFTRAYPGVGITLPNLQTNSVSAQAGVSYPIIRSRLQNLSVRGSFGLSNGKSESIPIAFRTHDQITAARIGFTWDGVDALRGVNIIDMEYSQGMKSFGASDRAADGSRANVPAGFQ